MTCPRCSHEIDPQDAVEFIAGQKTHVLQMCFDFVHADLAQSVSLQANLTAAIGSLQQTAITARVSEAQAVADMIDIQAQVDAVNAITADNAAKANQITQLNAAISGHNQAIAAVNLQLAQAQTNILNFAKERDAVVAENIALKAELEVLK